MKYKVLIIIISYLFFGCQSKKDEKLIIITNDWEIEGLQINKSTIKDVEEFAKSKKIVFKKDTISNIENFSDSIEYCGNDYRLHETNYLFTNDSLGIHINLVQINSESPIVLITYNLSKFENVKFEKGFDKTISKDQLDKNFKNEENLNLYENTTGKNTALLGVIQKSPITYDVKAFSVYQN